MAKASEITIRIGADTYKLEKSLKDSENSLKKSVKKMGEIGSNLTRSLTLPIAGVGAAAVASFAKFEQLEKALIAVSGSAEEADKEFAKLRESARLPGLGFEEAVRGSVRLQAVGLTADDARKSLETFGLAIAASGGGAENLERVVYQLTQMISKNRILQEDFGIIQENIPLIGNALEKAFGTRNIEAIRDAGVTAEEFNKRLVNALGTLPELQGDLGGLANSFENVKGATQQALVAFGEAIVRTFNLSNLAERLEKFILGLVDRFKALSPEMQKTVIQIAAVLAAIGPILVAVRGFSLALAAISSPIGIAVTALGLLAAAFIAFYNTSATFRGTITAIGYAFKSFADGFIKEVQKVGNIWGLVIQGRFQEALAVFQEEGVSFAKIGEEWNRGFAEGFNKKIDTKEFDELADKVKNLATSSVQSDIPALNLSGNGEVAPTRPDDVTVAALGAAGSSFSNSGNIEEIRTQIDLLTQSVEFSTQGMRDWADSLVNVNAELPKMLDISQGVNETMTGMQSVLAGAARAMYDAATSGEQSFKKLGKAALAGAAQVVRAKLNEAIAIYVSKAFAKYGIFGAVAALAGGALIQGIYSTAISALKIPALAQGGLAFSPTLAVVGDNRGAGADPEVIAPLSKLKQYLGGNNQVVGTFRVAGRDLELVLERSQADSSRVQPF
jgi:tape measure domain-containing protein